MGKEWKTKWIVCADRAAGDLVAEIGQAETHDEMPGVWFCPILIGSVFQKEKRIAGVDAEQALDLSLRFVRTVFDNIGADVDSFVVCRAGDD